MTSLPLGVGLIGCGYISGIYLTRAADFPQIEIRAVADRDPAAAAARGAEYGLPAMTPAELLARPDIDIVLNLTVPAAHAEVSLAAIAAGKHVYSEKPLAATGAEARAILAAAEAAGLRVGCAPDTFLGGAHQGARALIDAGAIGTPTAGSATLMLAGHERWHPNPDFYYQAQGGGPLLDMGPYYITGFVNLLGPVARVIGMGGRGRPERMIATGPRAGEAVPVSALTHVAGVLEFASGALVQIATSFDVIAHRHAPIEIYGTEGSMSVPDPNTFDGTVEIARDKDGWAPCPPTHGHGDGNYRAIGLADMAAAIAEGRAHRASGALALHVLEVMEALLGSAASGQAVTIESRPPRPAPLAAGAAIGEISGDTPRKAA